MRYIHRSRHIHPSRLGRLAMLASGAMLLQGAAASAQSVRVFDDPPSMEQLRAIMIPESRHGASRTIVIQRPTTSANQNSVQPASNQVDTPPQTSYGSANWPSPQIARPAPMQSAASQPTEPTAEPGVVAFHINFAFNSAALPESSHLMIDRIAQLMKEAPQVKLRVEGHTDAAGSVAYNKALSEQRALSVAQYLAAQGVEPARLILVGKGKSEPLTQDPYDPANRRVQFVRIG